MRLVIEREAILEPLQLVTGVVEKRQTLPILANVLLKMKGRELVLTGTDLEIEVQGRIVVEEGGKQGAITVPARKLLDICRTLPERSILDITLEEARLIIRSGHSRFSLATLPAKDFPSIEELPGDLEFLVAQKDLQELIEYTQFAMAQQDVRHYLNGMLWEVSGGKLRAITTDGHRLASNIIDVDIQATAQIIIPRKAILELSRMLVDIADNDVEVSFNSNQLQIKTIDYTFTTKLIDSRYPDYNKVIPEGGDKILILGRDLLKQALSRVSVLANEKQRNVRLELQPSLLRISANNPDQEEAEEELGIEYKGKTLNIGFNVIYLLDVLNALPAGDIIVTLMDPDSSIKIESVSNRNVLYVVMPMRL